MLFEGSSSLNKVYIIAIDIIVVIGKQNDKTKIGFKTSLSTLDSNKIRHEINNNSNF